MSSKPPFRYKKFFAGVAAVVLPGTVLVGAGGGAYLHNKLDQNAQRITAENSHNSDAIVVLSGGSGRIKTALEMCGPDQKLFISGCNEHNNLETIMRAAGLSYARVELNPANVELGYDALKTEGNAIEIARWLERNPDINNITIVTSDYHIPRTFFHLQRHLPAGVSINFFEVRSNAGLGMDIEEGAKTMFESFGYSGGEVIKDETKRHAEKNVAPPDTTFTMDKAGPEA